MFQQYLLSILLFFCIESLVMDTNADARNTKLKKRSIVNEIKSTTFKKVEVREDEMEEIKTLSHLK